MKKAHLLRWNAQALVAAYLEYASLGLPHSALHLDLFEQPVGESGFFSSLGTRRVGTSELSLHSLPDQGGKNRLTLGGAAWHKNG